MQDYLVFGMKTCDNEVHLVLSNIPGEHYKNSYEIIMGYEQNSKTQYKKYDSAGNAATSTFDTPNIIPCDVGESYWLTWRDRSISLGTGRVVGENVVFSEPELNLLEISAIALASTSTTRTAIWEFTRSSGMLLRALELAWLLYARYYKDKG